MYDGDDDDDDDDINVLTLQNFFIVSVFLSFSVLLQ